MIQLISEINRLVPWLWGLLLGATPPPGDYGFLVGYLVAIFLLPSWIAFEGLLRTQLPKKSDKKSSSKKKLVPKTVLSLVLLLLVTLGLLQVARARLSELAFFTMLALMATHTVRSTFTQRGLRLYAAFAEAGWAYCASLLSFLLLIDKAPWQIWLVSLVPALLMGSTGYLFALSKAIPNGKPLWRLMPRFLIMALYLGPVVVGFMVVANQLNRHYALALLMLLFSRPAARIIDSLDLANPKLPHDQQLTLLRSWLATVIGFELAIALVTAIPRTWLPF